MSQPGLDPTKHHLRISYWPGGNDASKDFVPTTRIEPYDSNREVREAYNRHLRSGDSVCAAAFLQPGEQPEPWCHGNAATSPDPTKWRLHVECWQYWPVPPHTQPAVIISQHDSQNDARTALGARRQAIFGCGGKILYAAYIPPAGSNTQPIVIVARLGA